MQLAFESIVAKTYGLKTQDISTENLSVINLAKTFTVKASYYMYSCMF